MSYAHVMIRLAAAGASLLIALGVTSCTAPDKPVASPSPTQSVSTSASPAPDPTSSVDPADLSHWQISEDGIGPFALGSALADAATAVPSLTRPADDACPFPQYLTLALPGGSALDPELSLEAGAQGLVTLIVTSRAGPVTASGIGVGSTVGDVLAAYPTAQTIEIAEGQFVYSVAGDPGWISFAPLGSGDAAPIARVWVQAGRGGGSEGCA
jgi:hypothetical protein